MDWRLAVPALLVQVDTKWFSSQSVFSFAIAAADRSFLAMTVYYLQIIDYFEVLNKHICRILSVNRKVNTP